MDSTNRRPHKRPVIWSWMTGVTKRLYGVVDRSFLGKGLTAYRMAHTAQPSDKQTVFRNECRPLSPARLRVIETLREGHLGRVIAYLLSAAAHCPIRFYGQFSLFYSFFGVLFHLIGAYARTDARINVTHLILYGAILLLGIPLLFSQKSAAQLLVKGRLTHWFFVGLLGLPEEQLNRVAERKYGSQLLSMVPYVAFLLAVISAVMTLWWHPLVIPVAYLLLAAVGMIFSFPETGVVLAVSTLPLVWWKPELMWLTVALILITWMGYGVKLLFMHRSIRFNRLDISVLLMMGTLLFSGMTGSFVTAKSVGNGILGMILLSLYFLITNLMTDRAQIKRCLIGPFLTLFLILLSVPMSELPQDVFAWMGGSRGGDFIRNIFDSVRTACIGMAESGGVCVILMAIPFVLGLLYKKRRPLYSMILILLAVLGFVGLYRLGTVDAFLIATAAVALFFLLYSHKCMAVGILALPALICGGTWMYAFYADRLRALASQLAASQFAREAIWKGAWQTVCHHPAGIGLGQQAFVSVFPVYAEAGTAVSISDLYMSVLVTTGIPGLAVLLILLFLFIQKSFTCLTVCGRREDNARVLGGMLSVISLMAYGFVSAAPTEIPVLLMLVTVLGLMSAYENMLFAEWETISLNMTHSDHSVDYFIRTPVS